MADPESQMRPLAPDGVRSDEPPSTTTAVFRKPKHQESSKALVYILATIVFLSTIFLIIASVFLRVVSPKLRLRTVSIQDFQYENTNSTSLNITMLTEFTVNNQNFGRYVFENCNAVVVYGNSTIGNGVVSGGRVGAKKMKSISVVMQIRSQNLNFSSDASDRMEVMQITSYAKMTGRVHVTKIVDRRKTIEMNCLMNLNLTSRSFMDPLCS
ncbi:hypothetical protein R6Q59_021982 [Mikania micrantha]|uniref:Late embryogenesis abundant protein LEA-2 subgroup domain-containing protein n=1 Tax=Mikania micrantha TaxID=192012 RepID=A0A5N6MW23_9ASTR|nr:hypothetical protein E3N88_26982 [Mikania micrantha]